MPKENYKTITIHEQTHRKLTRISKKEHISMSAIMTDLINQYYLDYYKGKR